jgi:hypothetical protein
MAAQAAQHDKPGERDHGELAEGKPPAFVTGASDP